MSTEIEPKTESHARGAAWTWVFWTGVVAVVYVLSIGPVNLLTTHGYLTKGVAIEVLDTVYSPLSWAYYHRHADFVKHIASL